MSTKFIDNPTPENMQGRVIVPEDLSQDICAASEALTKANIKYKRLYAEHAAAVKELSLYKEAEKKNIALIEEQAKTIKDLKEKQGVK